MGLLESPLSCLLPSLLLCSHSPSLLLSFFLSVFSPSGLKLIQLQHLLRGAHSDYRTLAWIWAIYWAELIKIEVSISPEIGMPCLRRMDYSFILLKLAVARVSWLWSVTCVQWEGEVPRKQGGPVLELFQAPTLFRCYFSWLGPWCTRQSYEL